MLAKPDLGILDVFYYVWVFTVFICIMCSKCDQIPSSVGWTSLYVIIKCQIRSCGRDCFSFHHPGTSSIVLAGLKINYSLFLSLICSLFFRTRNLIRPLFGSLFADALSLAEFQTFVSQFR